MQTQERADEGDKSKRPRGDLFKLYAACLSNAEELVDEARLLLDNGRFARAFALAYTAYEEIGKSQLVADASDDLVSQREFEKAFSEHKLKAAYVDRVVRLDDDDPANQPATIEYSNRDGGKLFAERNASLYVGRDGILPNNRFAKSRAENMIEIVDRELQTIQYAEWLNGRIGSKGSFK